MPAGMAVQSDRMGDFSSKPCNKTVCVPLSVDILIGWTATRLIAIAIKRNGSRISMMAPITKGEAQIVRGKRIKY